MVVSMAQGNKKESEKASNIQPHDVNVKGQRMSTTSDSVQQ
jgi:hypothetical protein